MFDYVKRMIASIVGRNNHEVNKEPRIIKASEHGIDPKLVSFAAVRTCSILQQRGYKAYVVGGAVRDLLLGVKPKDFDVATDATPEQVKRAQRRAFIIGRRFRLVHVVSETKLLNVRHSEHWMLRAFARMLPAASFPTTFSGRCGKTQRVATLRSMRFTTIRRRGTFTIITAATRIFDARRYA